VSFFIAKVEANDISGPELPRKKYDTDAKKRIRLMLPRDHYKNETERMGVEMKRFGDRVLKM